MSRRGRQITQAAANNRGRSRSRGGGGPKQVKHNNGQQNTKKPGETVQGIARRLAQEIRRLDSVGPQVTQIMPQAGEALEKVKEKYLTSMTMLKDEFRNKTEFEARISVHQVHDIVNSMNAQITEGITPATQKKIEQAVQTVKNLHVEHTDFLTHVMKLAEVMCGCPNEQIHGNKCSLSSNVPIDKQLDNLTQTRDKKVRKFNKDLEEFKANSPFGVSTPNYNYYLNLVKHEDDPDHKHPNTYQKHHEVLVHRTIKDLANMNMSENVRSDQLRSSASLRYL
jgi:hypothetical protein